MKKTFICLLAFFLFPAVCFAQAPKEIAGFVLGENIAGYKTRAQMQTALPIRYAEYLTEVEINPIEGFKSGLIAYGNCAVPGPILRIKLKYGDARKDFFDSLLKRYKSRFGAPLEWRGDPFHIFIAWKWSFTDSRIGQVSMVLQHNTRDEEEKMGNAVKLTATSLLEQERLCYEKKHPELPSAHARQAGQKSGSIPWDRLLPR